jgi:hypothetical protein
MLEKENIAMAQEQIVRNITINEKKFFDLKIAQ